MPLGFCLIIAISVIGYIAIAGVMFERWDKQEMKQNDR